MAATIVSAAAGLATGINVFTLPRERHGELIETLTAINREILTHGFPMIVSSNFHRAVDAPIVINYNQYTDRAQGQFLRTQPSTAPLMQRTHEQSEKHEIRWYEVVDVIGANGAADRLEISDNRSKPAAIAIMTLAPDRQEEMLALLKRYGETLSGARVPGFVGIALHRGYRPEHVAAYAQWESIEAYADAVRQEPAAELSRDLRGAAAEMELHLYDVVSVTPFK